MDEESRCQGTQGFVGYQGTRNVAPPGILSNNRYQALWEEDESEQGVGCLCQVTHDWESMEKITMTIDSGAVDTVGPTSVAKGHPTRPTEASNRGMFYKAANDTKIPIHGAKDLKCFTEKGDQVGMEIQIADVQRVLGSVRKMCEAGNKVVFEKGNCYIQNMVTGKTTPIKGGSKGYTIDLWVPKGDPGNRGFPGQGKGL